MGGRPCCAAVLESIQISVIESYCAVCCYVRRKSMKHCACGSKKPVALCCGPYLGGASAPTAEALMRSRYSAFVAGNLDYIENTSAGEARLKFNRTELEQSLPGTQWLGLEISERQGGQAEDTVGFITFRVQYNDHGRLFTQTERSEFRRIGGEWRYWKGVYGMNAGQLPVGPVGRNDPCTCGSSKKYKKCCGA
jgi:SEC-C motif domain protein